MTAHHSCSRGEGRRASLDRDGVGRPRHVTTQSGLRASRRCRPHAADPTTPTGRGEREEPPSCAPEDAQPCSCDRGTHAPRHTPWDSMGAAPARARKVADHVRALDTHRPSCAATHPGLLRGSARSASSVWVDGCKAHRKRSPRTCSHPQHGRIFVGSTAPPISDAPVKGRPSAVDWAGVRRVWWAQEQLAQTCPSTQCRTQWDSHFASLLEALRGGARSTEGRML